ncbi:MAG: helix-turn-helix transcriptional regulator [Peptostreptococcus sp.]|uniref:helix-turn-helix domain-containing protein n=1 Tax=Peptostreptococcus sp. TaxID=1262 RepID=UPI002FC87BB7
MREINIGSMIVKNRKLKNITQDELASYIGVSKSSVSKWETDQSYPDINFLPQIAGYFDISIDDLIGYKAQMEEEAIKDFYIKTSKKFANENFDDVMNYCRKNIKKYFSCYPFLYQVALMLVNNSSLAGGKQFEILDEARVLLERVISNSDDIELIKQAINIKGLILLTLGKSDDVIELLGESIPYVMSSQILLSSAYQMKGEEKKAKKTLQIEIYQYYMNLIQLMSSYLPLCFDDKDKFDETCKRILELSNTFKLDRLLPTNLLSFYLLGAQGNVIHGENERALEYLDMYVKLATSNIYPLKLKNDEFFNLIDEWFETFAIGKNPPRDEKVIKESILDAVEKQASFEVLKDDIRFINIIKKLNDNCLDK